MRRETTRKVYFYRSFNGLTPAGRALDFNSEPTIKLVQDLPFEEGGNYQAAGGGEFTCCWVDRTEWTPYRLRLGKVRRNDLPQVEEHGDLSPLPIPPNSGLAEQTHVCFFPDNIVGFLYNHYAPRLPKLADYLSEKDPTRCSDLRFEALFRTDILEQVESLREVRLIELRLRASEQSVIEDLDESLGATLRGAAELGKVSNVGIILRPEKYSREPLGKVALNRVKHWARSLRSSNPGHSVFEKFVVKGVKEGTEIVDEIDVLGDYLVSEEQVVFNDERSRALNDKSAYSAIEKAFAELQGDIRSAASIWRPTSS